MAIVGINTDPNRQGDKQLITLNIKMLGHFFDQFLGNMRRAIGISIGQ